MYCYIDGSDCFVVGFFGPSGYWMAESDHKTRAEAAARVHYLNGGSGTAFLSRSVDRVCDSLGFITDVLSQLSDQKRVDIPLS